MSGWTLCQEKLAQFPQVTIAVEAGHSAAIERLVALNYRVYPVHPRSSKSYRPRRLPSGLKIIAAMIRNQTPFDAAIHTRNQLQHGSWVLQLQPLQVVKGNGGD